MKLDEIPGLLPINKVKPKKKVENLRVTQICESMEGKDVIKVVEELKEKKNEKALARESKAAKKREQKEVFLKRKNACICEKEKCDAFGLKECSNCHDVL